LSTGEVKKGSFIGSASTVSGATALSRVFGLVREQVMAYFFGAGLATDAFVAAFRIPNLLRDMFAEGALSSSFVPVFKARMINDTQRSAFQLANIVITLMLMAIGLIVVLGIIASPAIVYVFANGFTDIPAKFDLPVALTRAMMVYLLLVSVSALFMGMLNSFGRFGVPAFSPAMFNIGSILAVVMLYQYFDPPIYTMAIGVVVGGIGQVVIQIPSLLQIGYRYRPSFDFLNEGVKKVMRLLGPMVIGMSGSRVNILVSTLVASYLVQGSLSYLNYSYRLMHFPLGVFAVALGTVTLPRVSEMVVRKEFHRLEGAFREAIDIVLFIVVPSAAFLALMGNDLVDLIYRWGRFDVADSENSALALMHYSYGLIGFAAVRVVVPFFYAFEDSKLPMRISLISVAANMALYYPLVKLLSFAGLASATSIAGLLNFFLLVYYLPSKGVPVNWKQLILTSVKTIVSATVAFAAARFIPLDFTASFPAVWGRMLNLMIPTCAACLVYLTLCSILKVPGFGLLVGALKRRRSRNTEHGS